MAQGMKYLHAIYNYMHEESEAAVMSCNSAILNGGSVPKSIINIKS